MLSHATHTCAAQRAGDLDGDSRLGRATDPISERALDARHHDVERGADPAHIEPEGWVV